MPAPTPPKWMAWGASRPAASGRMIDEVKIMANALARPARKRIRMRTESEELAAMAASRSAVRKQRRQRHFAFPPGCPAIGGKNGAQQIARKITRRDQARIGSRKRKATHHAGQYGCIEEASKTHRSGHGDSTGKGKHKRRRGGCAGHAYSMAGGRLDDNQQSRMASITSYDGLLMENPSEAQDCLSGSALGEDCHPSDANASTSPSGGDRVNAAP